MYLYVDSSMVGPDLVECCLELELTPACSYLSSSTGVSGSTSGDRMGTAEVRMQGGGKWIETARRPPTAGCGRREDKAELLTNGSSVSYEK